MPSNVWLPNFKRIEPNELQDNYICQHPQFPTTQTKSFGMRWSLCVCKIYHSDVFGRGNIRKMCTLPCWNLILYTIFCHISCDMLTMRWALHEYYLFCLCYLCVFVYPPASKVLWNVSFLQSHLSKEKYIKHEKIIFFEGMECWFLNWIVFISYFDVFKFKVNSSAIKCYLSYP